MIRKYLNEDGKKRIPAAALMLLLAGSLACPLQAAETEMAAETEAEAVLETEAELFAEAETEAETAAPEEAKVKYTSVKKFLGDVGAAVNDRNALASAYTEAELSMMTNDEIAQANQDCCESERWLMDRYSDAQFESRNLQYLCEQYLTGLQNQYDAYDSWQEKQDIDAYNELWEAGFAKRAVVVVELQKFYGVEFADIADMQAKAKELESLDELKSTKASESAIRTVQEHLNTLKFPVGTVDGYCGYRTVQMIRRFQNLYGYLPADGVIDEELIGQLTEEVQKITGTTEETETETEESAE